MRTPTSSRSAHARALWLLILVLGCGGSPDSDANGSAGADSSGGEVAADDFDGDLSLDDDADGPQAGTVIHRASAAEVLGLTPPETPWAEMEMRARNDYMIGKVLPIMDEAFRGHDASTYAELGCESCHGQNCEEREYAMPNPRASIVPAPGSRAWTGMEATFPEMVEFMQGEVVPKMTSIMGYEITCASCHPSAAPTN